MRLSIPLLDHQHRIDTITAKKKPRRTRLRRRNEGAMIAHHPSFGANSMFNFDVGFSNTSTLFAPPPAPVPIAQMPDLTDKRAWQRHTMARLYDLSTAEDPKIALSALDKIAKTSVADLMTPTVQINYQTKSTEELESALLNKINKILGANTQPALEADFTTL